MSSLALYHRAPTPVRTALASVHGLRLRRWRYGTDTERLVAAAREREHWDRDRWEDWLAPQRSRLLEAAPDLVGYTGQGGGPELASWPVAACQSARVTRALVRNPTFCEENPRCPAISRSWTS